MSYLKIKYYKKKTYHDQVSGRGRQVVCRNEKWMSQKDHSILSLIRLNATYTCSHTSRYFSLILSLRLFSYIFSSSVSIFDSAFDTMYRKKTRRQLFFLAFSLFSYIYEDVVWLPFLSLVCEHTALLLFTHWRSLSSGCCSYWLIR
jgi:hypothetical protein